MTAVLSEPSIDAQVSVRGAPEPGFPVEPNTTASVAAGLAMWLGPDEWLVLGGREEDFPTVAAVADVSANRVAFELLGAGARDVLARGCALDLDPAVFPPGRCAQTLLAGVQMILVCSEPDAWRILVRPSLAPYLRAWLQDAGCVTA